MTTVVRAAPRTVGLLAGLAGAAAMVVVGCTAVTRGSAAVDGADLPVYRASVSSSVASSQSVVRVRAAKASCDTLAQTSVDAIAAVNTYVDAENNQSPDAADKAGPASDALGRSADAVSGAISDTLPAPLRDALGQWVDSARTLAGVIASSGSASDFNDAIGKVNDTKLQAINACQGMS